MRLANSALSICFLFLLFHASAQPPHIKELAACKATLHDSVLTLENDMIARSYRWNEGDLKSTTLTDKRSQHTFRLNPLQPDAFFPGADKASNGQLEVQEVVATPVMPARLEAVVSTVMGGLEVKRVFKIYPACPAIACDYYLRGTVKARWTSGALNSGDLRNIEGAAAEAEGKSVTTIMEQLALPGKHWQVRAVQFYDITDRNNNLVQEYNQLLYRSESRLAGNILFAKETLSDHGVFILKEAPSSSVQLAYPGFDFLAGNGRVAVAGIGVVPEDLDRTQWTRCYGFVTGVTSGDELAQLTALRKQL